MKTVTARKLCTEGAPPAGAQEGVPTKSQKLMCIFLVLMRITAQSPNPEVAASSTRKTAVSKRPGRLGAFGCICALWP